MRNDTLAFEDAAIRQIAPRPRNLAETGLTQDFLCDLLAKHCYWGGILNQQQLVERTALAWPVLETLLNFMRTSGYIEVLSPNENTMLLRYGLTERGRNLALDAQLKSGYVGYAPVPLALYERVVQAQSIHKSVITRKDMARIFKDVVIRESVLDQLGPAMHSGRPIFVYGPPGTGKTYTGMRLLGLLDDSILVPYALAVGDYVVQFFDPSIHHPLTTVNKADRLMLDDGHDPRLVRCQRPSVITGGELTLDMLELAHDATTKQYFAPLQLKANNGIYMIDDLGRQRVECTDLLNRWIVPLEQKLAKILAEPNLTVISGQDADFLSGGEFPVPVPQNMGVGGASTVTIQFKPFGVMLKFLPVVLDSGRISMKLNIDVSEISADNAVVLPAGNGSFVIPSLTKRSANSSLELDDGQTLGIAGLINDSMRESISKFPGLGDIPVLGQLFTSQKYLKNETELVIFVTPHLVKPIAPDSIQLPTDKYIEPSDMEYYLMGRTEARKMPARVNSGQSYTGGLRGHFGQQP
ncbi:MAG: hypothetical protein ACXWT1_04895 [Methylobacter sp.]